MRNTLFLLANAALPFSRRRRSRDNPLQNSNTTTEALGTSCKEDHKEWATSVKWQYLNKRTWSWMSSFSGLTLNGYGLPESSMGSLSKDFFTWSDSPVRELSSIFRSLPWIRIPSAGNKSPVWKKMNIQVFGHSPKVPNIQSVKDADFFYGNSEEFQNFNYILVILRQSGWEWREM